MSKNARRARRAVTLRSSGFYERWEAPKRRTPANLRFVFDDRKAPTLSQLMDCLGLRRT